MTKPVKISRSYKLTLAEHLLRHALPQDTQAISDLTDSLIERNNVLNDTNSAGFSYRNRLYIHSSSVKHKSLLATMYIDRKHLIPIHEQLKEEIHNLSKLNDSFVSTETRMKGFVNGIISACNNIEELRYAFKDIFQKELREYDPKLAYDEQASIVFSPLTSVQEVQIKKAKDTFMGEYRKYKFLQEVVMNCAK